MGQISCIPCKLKNPSQQAIAEGMEPDQLSKEQTDTLIQKGGQVESGTETQESREQQILTEAKQPGQKNNRSIPNTQSQNRLNKTGEKSDTKVNLVLLGMTGTGKSASGNTILRNKVFTSKPSSNPVTTECQVKETEIKDIHVRVIDTPDIFDDEIEPSVKEKHVKKCIDLCQSQPCVYILVMHVSRFTDGERDILKKLEVTFGSDVKEQTVILFTRGDDLQEANLTLEDFIHSCQHGLKEIIEKCGNRCVLFENRSSGGSDQVEKLMDAVIRVLNKTIQRE